MNGSSKKKNKKEIEECVGPLFAFLSTAFRGEKSKKKELNSIPGAFSN